MKYVNSLKISGNPRMLANKFKAEQEKRARSELKISKGKNSITITVSAEDATALKATVSGIINLLTVSEKLENIE